MDGFGAGGWCGGGLGCVIDLQIWTEVKEVHVQRSWMGLLAQGRSV